MPRCHIRCNIITHPNESSKTRLRAPDLLPYLPCFYHVPVKVVYQVLGISHHTLSPMRTKHNLKRWPFADVCRGAFKVNGEYLTWYDIENYRLEMMRDADPRIVKILEVMGKRAHEHKHKVNVVLAQDRKRRQEPIVFDETAVPSDSEWLENFSRLLEAEFDACESSAIF